MSKLKRFRELVPPWDMPSDPVKAVWWFLRWFLKVLVKFFWIPILGMTIYEAISNGRIGIGGGIVSGVFTVFVGLIVWAVLRGLLIIVNVSTGISQVVSSFKEVQQQQSNFFRQANSQFMSMDGSEREEKIVEGTVTDLDEERLKRRHEQ